MLKIPKPSLAGRIARFGLIGLCTLAAACQPPPQLAEAGNFAGLVFSMPNPMDGRMAQMESSHAPNGEYVKYIKDFPADLIRIEAITGEKTPAAKFLNQIYFPKFIRAGVPEAQIIESGEQQTALGTAAYLQVRMVEDGSGSKGTSGVRVDAIRTVLAANVGSTLVIASRQRDEEGFNGSFDGKQLDPADQLASLVKITNTIQVGQ